MLHTLDKIHETLVLSNVARAVRRGKLTYLTTQKLRTLEVNLRHVARRGVVGDFAEFGVALGGSAILIASRMGPVRCFHGYDVFGMIPPPGDNDDATSHRRYDEIQGGHSHGIGGDPYYGYVDDLYGKVCRAFADFGLIVDGKRVALHRGLFADTLATDDPRPLAFVHIDCDWYDPVRYCLGAVGPRVPPGGRIILDDYNDYGGCRRAADEFLAAMPGYRLIQRAPNAVLERS